MKEVVVSRSSALKLEKFFPWVYKNEILSDEDYEKGEIVIVRDELGKSYAVGYINTNSIISVRVFDFKVKDIDEEFLKEKILDASLKRENINSDAYRLIHSEADMLPGLIVDKYGDYLSCQFNTAGILRLKDTILKLLSEIFTPKGIYVNADFYSLKKEGVADFETTVLGEIPDEIIIEENDVKFCIDITGGQKTGFYLDQRRNREIVTKYIKKRDRVLDVFSHAGGFGLYAAAKKEAEVTIVDISSEALLLAKRNFSLNGAPLRDAVEANAFDYLRELRNKKVKYDVVLLDPPSFAKSKDKKRSALRGFKDLFVNGLKLVDKDGMICIFSCSHYIDMDDLKDIALKASKDTGIRLEVMEHLYQDTDHPYILNIPHSLYLKGILFKRNG
ncbi:class I SAM-dependent rRNA methyltransferase [Nitrosophilus alvini]|uniref:class I SAM-dependent rRNA methyltransferase n=1 Tax=Nitrosophilus alvini TaxID=2714855 RepID=UPI00190BF060|nr:class I SAM-dependent rRNA methyltransferase [Nitrosophilus alvini]